MSPKSVMFVNTVVVLGKSSSLLGKAATTNSLRRHLGFGGQSPRGQRRERVAAKKENKQRKRYRGRGSQLKRNSQPESHTLWDCTVVEWTHDDANIDYNKT